jgi:SAM-dependent methyltransferase
LALAENRSYYDALWTAGRVVRPERFNTWALLSDLARDAPARLEIGPGLHPRLPLAGTHFFDLSAPALGRLKTRGGMMMVGDATALPYRDRAFDLVCAFDIVEHVADDRPVFREIRRVSRPGATVVLAVPLHPARWTAFDDLVGHVRRYEADALVALLAEHGLTIDRSAMFGMEPRSGKLLDFAVWGLTKRPAQAMRWYNAVFLPLGLLLQPRLALTPALLDVANVGEVLLVCRRS